MSTNYQFLVGDVGTATLKVDDYAILGVAQILDLNLLLPAGRWRISSLVSSSPLEGSGKPVKNSVDTGDVGAGSRTLTGGKIYRAHKPMSGGVLTFRATVFVDKWNGTSWVRYRSGKSSAILTTPIGSVNASQRRGVNVHIFSGGETAARINLLLDAAKDMGFTTVRTAAPWSFIEQTAKGVQDATALAQLDAFFTKCNAIGLDVLLVAGGGSPPVWSRSTGAIGTTSWQGHTYQYRDVGGGAPDNWTDYEDYVKWLITRYSSQRLVALEPMNEPNTTSWTASDSVIAAWCTHLYDAVNASTSPGILAVAAALAYCDYSFLERLFVAGLGSSFDAVSVHPYPFTWSVQGQLDAVWNPKHPLYDSAPWWHGHAAVESILETLDAHTSGKPVWVTEIGLPTFRGMQGFDESAQGPLLSYILQHLSRHPRVEGVLLHTMENRGDGTTYNPDPYSWSGNFGFLRENRVTKKPSYDQVKATLTQLAGG